MMIRQKFITVLVVLGISMYTTASLATTKYNFSQSGFDEGAILTGMFEAEDLDGDGVLTDLDGMITAFSVEFSGNSIVPAFTLGSADDFSKFEVMYDLDDGSLGGTASEEMLLVLGSDFSVFVGSDALGECENEFCGVVGASLGEPTTISLDPVTVSAVPLPAAAWLFGSGLLWFIGMRLKK
jgi:hypothetical protein